MKIVAYILSGICIFFGILFIWGAFGTPFDGGALVIGLIMVAIGLAIILIVSRKKQAPQQVTYQVDLGGDIKVNKMTCQHCGGALSTKDVKLIAGAPTVSCPYCGQSYQITEEPKW